MAMFNDEWYDDLTDVLDIANPAGIYATRAEAEAAVVGRTRATVRGAAWHELLLGQDGTDALVDMVPSPPDPLPASLTDEEVDDLVGRLHIQLFHVLEADLPATGLREAQAILSDTPERPAVVIDYDDDGEVMATAPDDPVTARLNRVTQLFGRRYAIDPGF